MDGWVYAYQGDDDLAIGVCLEVVGSLQSRSQLDMVINLAIDTQHGLLIIANQRLCSRVYTQTPQTRQPSYTKAQKRKIARTHRHQR